LHGPLSNLLRNLEFVGFMQSDLHKVLGQRNQLGIIGDCLVNQL
jgi:hypothetical protein